MFIFKVGCVINGILEMEFLVRMMRMMRMAISTSNKAVGGKKLYI